MVWWGAVSTEEASGVGLGVACKPGGGAGSWGGPTLFPTHPSLVSHQKHPKGADFAARMDGWEGISELLAKLWVSRGLEGLCCRHCGGGTLPWKALGWVPEV